jgi:hypothetical protein
MSFLINSLKTVTKGFGDYAFRVYRASLAKDLGAYGLRIEDVMIETPDVKFALSQLPPAEKEQW